MTTTISVTEISECRGRFLAHIFVPIFPSHLPFLSLITATRGNRRGGMAGDGSGLPKRSWLLLRSYDVTGGDRLCESAIDAICCRALHPSYRCLSTGGTPGLLRL